MQPAVDTGRFRPRRRISPELGMTPLIDIVFLLLLFFMLTSSFIVDEGIQVDLPATRSPHYLPSNEVRRIMIRSDGTFLFQGSPTTLPELEIQLKSLDPGLSLMSFQIQSDRRAAVWSVVSLLEFLRKNGATRVSLGTVSAGEVDDR